MADAQHTMTLFDAIAAGAIAIGGTVGGVVAALLRVNPRVKALEESETKRSTLAAEMDALRIEIGTHRTEMAAALTAAKVDPLTLRVLVDQIAGPLVEAKVNMAFATNSVAISSEIATLKANLQNLSGEQGRMRNVADEAAAEGARRWAEMSASVARLTALVERLIAAG